MRKIKEVVVTENSDACGGVVWWELHGHTSYQELQQAGRDAGLPEDVLPSAVTPEVALYRAVSELKEKHRLVRPIPKKRAWAIVDEGVDQVGLTYRMSYTVRLDALSNLVIEEASGDKVDELLGLHAKYAAYLERLTTQDISGWLVDLAHYMKALQLRTGGGMYFIPNDRLEEWRRYVQVVEAVGAHQVWLMPAMRTSEAVKAVLASLQAEAKATVEELQSALVAGDEGKLGAKGLSNRAEKAAEMKEKVIAYEGLLNQNLESLREELDSIRASLAAAALAADDSEDAAA